MSFFAVSIGAAIATSDPDFHYLVLMWPGAYCKQSSNGCCYPETGKPELDFFVSGLLPASNDGTLLLQCNKIPFHIKELVDMKESLISYWPNIKCPSKGGRFVWKNTGYTWGIILTDYADYSLSEMEKAINSGVGANTAIRCAKNDWDESIIYEVFVCVNKDATRIVSCPALPNSSCTSRIVFGSFTYDMLEKDASVVKNPIRARVSLK
ncbi:hypothetical protein QJS10_CPB18g00691 [Acorus calamus]|uniref:Uncharacterized protein n=1 Tax=Acorus calamus TaxID=4465 RepID=A0AAV9CR08_ACOCL|nr:hypothetical protein QJS10_CPB18g00691 [Acorus calamus]